MTRPLAIALLALLPVACATTTAPGGAGSPRLSGAERAYLVDGDADAAEAQLVAEIERAPTEPEPWFLLADLLDATGRPGAAAERYLAAIELARTRPAAADVASAAAMAIVAIRDRVPGFRARFAAAADVREAPGALPAEAAFELRNLAFGLALRGDDEPETRAAAMRATGCLNRWEVIGPFGPGTFAALDGLATAFPQLTAGSPWPTEAPLGPGRGLAATRAVDAIRCSIPAFDASLPLPGLGLARTVVGLDRATTVLFRLESDASTRVWAGGVEIHSAERRDAWLPRYAWFAADLPAGNTEIAVAVAHPEVRPVFSLAAVDAATGAPIPLHGPRLVPSGIPAAPRPLPEPAAAGTATAALARLRAAIWRADAPAIEAETAALARFGAAESWPLLVAGADAALSTPDRPLDTAFEAARRAMEIALEKEPRLWAARLALARAESADGRPEIAYELLRAGREIDPEEPAIAERLAELCLELGYAGEARAAAAALADLLPGGCAPTTYRLAAARGTAGPQRIRQLAAEVAACDRTSDALAAALLDAQRWDEARAELRRLAERDPDNPALVEAEARAALAAGDPDGFVRGLRRLLALAPSSPERQRALADALAAGGRGDDARAVIARGLASPGAPPGRAAQDLAALAGADLYPALRVDGLAAIGAFRAAAPRYDTGSVWVLDRAVHVIGRDGARLEIVHNVAAILTAGAVAEHGEAEIPEGATILTARVIKADGTVRTPEAIPGKASLSLPDLAPGDFVELEYAAFAPPSPVFLGGFDTGRFYFRDFDHAFARSELIVVAPRAMPIELDPRGAVPAAAERTYGDLRVLAFRARAVEPAVAEPHAPSAAELLPSIRVTSGATREAFCARVRELLADRERRSPEIDAIAARLVAGIPAADRGARLAAIYSWVMENVDDDGDLEAPVAHVIARRAGSRVRAFLALARAVGVEGRLAFVRAATADDTPTEVAALDLAERVAALVDGRWASFETEAAPFGFLPPELRRRPALLPDRCEEAATDGGAVPAETLRVEATIEIDAAGDATARVTERLAGAEAAAWRSALRGTTDDERLRLFAAERIARVAPGAALLRFAASPLEDAAAPLVLEYDLSLPGLLRRTADGMRGALPFARSLARDLGGRPTRSAPAVLATYADESISITVTAPPRGAIRTGDPDGRAESPFGTAGRRVEGGGATLNVRQELRLDAGRIAPEGYRALLEFAAAVDDLSAVEIVLTPPEDAR